MEADYFLPRQIPQGVNPKWRVAGPETVCRNWERRIADHDRSGLTDAQNAAIIAEARKDMQEDIASAALNSQLSRWVSFGLFEYLLIPVGIVLGIRQLVRGGRLWSKSLLVACVATNLVAGVLVVYRGYFSAVFAS